MTGAGAAALGAGTGLGLLIIILAVAGKLTRVDPVRLCTGGRQPYAMSRLVGCAGLAVVAGLVTGWPAGALLAVAAVWALPPLLGRDVAHARTVARIEAVAAWTEMLRDTLAASKGLRQSIVATAPIAPEAIRPQVSGLAARIRRREPLPVALRHLASELADPTADLVVAALVQAERRGAGELAALLGTLADAARQQAVMRLRVAAGRARVRTSIRVIVAVTLTMACALVLFNRGFLAPYDTAPGQLWLLLVGGCFAGSFVLLRRTARIGEPPRVLSGSGALR